MNIYPKKYYPDADKKVGAASVRPAHLKKATPAKAQSNKISGLNNINQTQLNGTIPLPNMIHRVLSKMAYGSNADDTSYIQALPGATDQDKLLVYIDEQLDPNTIDDSFTDSILNNAGYTTLNKTRIELYQEHLRRPDGIEIPWQTHILPGRETHYATFVRGINSKRQLFETLTDFWHNHFNVYIGTNGLPAMFGNYDRNVIRGNALGNFRQMLYDVTQSTCMLSYLGNGVNELTAPNENYAREILELHSISAKNYFGHMPWDDVPLDNEGRRVGYVEEDVLELARALTGWSFSGADWWDYQNGNIATGEFLYRDEWHDKGVKRVMGINYSYDAGDPMKDMNDVLDMLAEHPATAEFLATKLCKRFISDNPSMNIIDQVKDSLHLNWQAADQIKLAMEVLLKSPEFLNNWAEKIKRPLERTISSMRQIEYSFDFDPTESLSGSHYWGFLNSGQSPFQWTSPNGYPDTKQDWLGASSTMSTWRFVQWIARLR
ncbi:MAG: DUF1800 domain-containing protein, partial [Proteobacteria bacterium]|nr:DUF1800 domain-containing protein [Pseudomonadota bacterium]